MKTPDQMWQEFRESTSPPIEHMEMMEAAFLVGVASTLAAVAEHAVESMSTAQDLVMARTKQLGRQA